MSSTDSYMDTYIGEEKWFIPHTNTFIAPHIAVWMFKV